MRLFEVAKTLNPPSISVGDEVKVGKWKNRKAEVKGFTKDDHGQPVLKTTKGDQKLYKPRVSKLEPKEVDEAAFKRQPVDHSLPFDDHESESFIEELKKRDELWRGPHEGRYLQLFLAGKKPAILIMLNEIEPFQKYIDNGQLTKHDITVFNDTPNYVLTVPGEEWRANKLRRLFSSAVADKYWESGKEALWHGKVGLLLGYTNTDIRNFMKYISEPNQ